MPQSFKEIIGRYPDTISKTVDLSFELTSQTGRKYKRGLPDPALIKFIPMERYISARLAFRKIAETRPTLAFIVGVDGEYPIKKEPVELSIELVGSIKIARATLMTETDYDLLREAELHLKANEPEVYNLYIRQYMQMPAYLTQTVVCLCSVLLFQIFAAGQCTYIDPETGLGFELSYVSKVPSGNRPLALTGTNLWSDSVNSKPLENLRDHFNNYYRNVFKLPDALVMSSTVADYMLSANDTKLKIARMKGFQNIPDEAVPGLSRPTIEDCRQWLSNEITSAAQGGVTMSEFIVSDAFYYTQDVNGTDVPVPYIPTDTYSFFNEGLLEGAYVPTATNDYQSTFAIVTEELSLAPKREKVSIDTRFLAACPDPRYLGWRKVI